MMSRSRSQGTEVTTVTGAFCISVIGYINVQIIGIGYKKINIGRSLHKICYIYANIGLFFLIPRSPKPPNPVRIQPR